VSQTSIEWTQRTWNPVRGCSRVSPGCQHCYAERQAARNLPGMKSPTGESFAIINGNGPHWTGKVELIPSMLDVPLKRKKPTTWFVNSMSDLFHEDLDTQARDRIFDIMEACPQHTFQILTKRAELMQREMEFRRKWREIGAPEPYNNLPRPCPKFTLPNVWLGVSVEDQQRADERIPLLLQTPAAIRFLSVEPLLGPVNLTALSGKIGGTLLNCLDGRWDEDDSCVPGIDWVIVGGESGPGARPMHPDWPRSIRDQCQAAGVPFFFKQWGGWIQRPSGHLLPVEECQIHPRLGIVTVEYPPDLPIHEAPQPKQYRAEGMIVMSQVGKKKAGRMLDGRTWDEMPIVHS
jgi:protein gp37